MALPTTPLDHEERLRRAEAAYEALATLRLEGLEPSDQAKALMQQHIDGTLSFEQLGAAISRLHDRSLRVPRHERPSESEGPAGA